MAVVGIDFGSYSCFIAVARSGGIETVANEYSDRSTPTYVSLNDRQRAMGAAAKQQATTNVKNTLIGFKSFLGRKFCDPVVQSEIKRLHYTVKEGPDGTTGIQVRYMDSEQVFSPEQITAMMLTKLKHIAETNLVTKVVDVVISVPCSFTDHQRRSMLEACQMAGLNCLRIMNDSLAVSLSYGIYKQDLPVETEKSRHVVFVDMGYTSMQVSLCALNKGKLKMLAVVTDPNLGGREFDRVLLDHFTAELKKKYKIDIASQPKAEIRMLSELEKAKRLMSANAQNIPINIECLMNDVDIHTSIDRATFEQLSASILSRVKRLLASLLPEIKFSLNDVHSVEIVGGSSRVPAVKALVRETFNMEPSMTLNADEAVARGCALECAILSPTFRVRDFSVTDCQLYPITLRWQGGLNEDCDLEICPKYHAVPFFKMLTYFRSEPLTINCKYTYPNDIPYPDPVIGSFRVDKIQAQANGESSKVKVKVNMNIHGIFSVSSAALIEKLPETDEVKDDGVKVNGEVNNVEMGRSDTEQSSSNEDQTGTQDDAHDGSQGEHNGSDMQTDEITDEAVTDNKADKKGDKKGEKVSPKKKKTTRSVDLPVIAMVNQLSKVALHEFVEKEAQMIMQDKLEKERQYARNSVEEYIYDMRDKLYSIYKGFILEEDRDTFSQVLTAAENWIYDEGEDVAKSVYVEKLESMKWHGEPVVKRHREAMERPAALEALGGTLQRIRKVLELVAAKDEKYEHLTSDDLIKVEKCVRQKTEWFEKQLNLLNKLTPTDNPTVLVAQIVTEQESLEAVCNPIVNKPKPKVEAPKVDKPVESDVGVKKEATKESTDASSEQQGQGEGSDETMEVD